MAPPRSALRYALLLLSLGRPAVAGAASPECARPIPAAERYYALPPGLLSAVASVESGQYPWTLNLNGQPVLTSDFASAAKLLRTADGVPRRDVAVGCLQIHMRYHLDHFPAPEWALLPDYNVWYGAAYLRELKDRYGDWGRAVAHYNGSDPAAQKLYVSRVVRKLTVTRTRSDPAEEAARQRLMAARRNSPLIVERPGP